MDQQTQEDPQYTETGHRSIPLSGSHKSLTSTNEEIGEDSASDSFEENFNPDEPHQNFGHCYTESSSSAAVSETGTDPIETSESDGTGSGNAGDVSSSDSESVGNQHSDSDDNYWEYYTAEESD